MNISFRAIVAAVLAAVMQSGMALAQSLQDGAPELNGVLTSKIVFALRWTAYWEPDSVIHYTPGEIMPVRLVQSPEELAVFFSKIRVALTFSRSPDGHLDKLDFVYDLSRIGNETLDSDVSFYIQMHATPATPGFRLKPGAQPSQTGGVLPTERVATGSPPTPESFRVSDSKFRLPTLMPPDYITSRTRPAALVLDSLKSAVTEAAQSHMRANSQPAEIVIPYFSAEDPVVNIFVDFHEPELGQGIFWVRPDVSGGWSIGKLILNRGPEHLDSIINKIRHLSLARFTVVPKR